jgi:hypothetical protein
MSFFQIGTRYYRQIVGIPQGSVLSTILCSFLFGDLERTQLNVLDDPKSVRVSFLCKSSSLQQPIVIAAMHRRLLISDYEFGKGKVFPRCHE